jgi:hypothetical protein
MQLYTLPSNHSQHKPKPKFSSPWMAFRHRIRNYRRMGKLFAKTALKQQMSARHASAAFRTAETNPDQRQFECQLRRMKHSWLAPAAKGGFPPFT